MYRVGARSRRAAGTLHQRLLGVSHGKSQVVQATSLHSLKETQFFADVSERLGVHLHFLVGNGQSRNLCSAVLQKVGDQGHDHPIGNQTDDDTHWDGEKSKNDSNTPDSRRLVLRNLESSATVEDNEHLASTHNAADANKEPIAGKTLKDIKVVVKTTVTRKRWVSDAVRL